MPQTGTQIQSGTADTANDRILCLIRAKDIKIAFQPIVDLRDGSIAAFEALTRPGDSSGFNDPGALFDQAATAGLLWPLEELTRELALQGAAELPPGVRLFFNCTPEVLSDSRFAETFERDISGLGNFGRERLVLEVTELPGDENVDALAAQVTRLKEMGLEVAIDDVGAGTSGLNRVMQLRPHWLKLDHEFIKGIDTDSFKQNLVRFFVHFSRLSDVNVIAEGIENKEELGVVVSLGVRFGQGYFLARPATKWQIGSKDYATRVQEHWAEVESVAAQVPGTTLMRHLCRPAQITESTATIEAVATALSRDPKMTGMVVGDGRTYVGWCHRARVEDEVEHGRGYRPITYITSSGVCAVSPEATVHDALHLINSRDDQDLSQPLLVTDAGEVIGIVSLRDLLDTAIHEGIRGSDSRTTLTGLPGRVDADQHLAMLVEGACQTRGEPGIGLGDAAFVDIRRFAEYNATYGYDLGDRAIRELADLMQTIVVQDEPGIFLAHLGDDRFLFTAPPGILPQRLRAMMDEFDRCYASSPLVGGADGAASNPNSLRTSMSACLSSTVPFVGLCLRVLHIPDAFSRIKTPRELYQIEQQLRQRSKRAVRLARNVGKSIFMTDTKQSAGRLLRLTA
jgi:EAL domain-containing protein (putative c-di-GMP-specific phosphodiesterase class I)/GGDEF domain-containing protein/CBS domain-containing protein